MNPTSTPSFVFFGTPEFSVRVLEKLKAAGLLPSLIVTAPDRPKGRKLVLTPPPVKVWADANGIPTLQPETLKDAAVLEKLSAAPSWDIFVVVAYGKIIPKTILELPKHGTINVHPSLLPLFRGPSPIESAILNNVQPAGVTIMQIDEEVDHGPILAQKIIETPEWPLRADLLETLLANVGGALLAETLPRWVAGEITPQIQDHAQATFTKKITKEDGLISLDDDPHANYLKFQGLYPWPGTYFFAERNGTPVRVIIKAARYEDGAFIIERVLPEGGHEMPYEDFLRGLHT